MKGSPSQAGPVLTAVRCVRTDVELPRLSSATPSGMEGGARAGHGLQRAGHALQRHNSHLDGAEPCPAGEGGGPEDI